LGICPGAFAGVSSDGSSVGWAFSLVFRNGTLPAGLPRLLQNPALAMWPGGGWSGKRVFVVPSEKKAVSPLKKGGRARGQLGPKNWAGPSEPWEKTGSAAEGKKTVARSREKEVAAPRHSPYLAEACFPGGGQTRGRPSGPSPGKGTPKLGNGAGELESAFSGKNQGKRLRAPPTAGRGILRNLGDPREPWPVPGGKEPKPTCHWRLGNNPPWAVALPTKSPPHLLYGTTFKARLPGHPKIRRSNSAFPRKGVVI